MSVPHPRHMHLGLNLRAIGFHNAAWRHPLSSPHRIFDIDFYIEIARIAERGKFDAIFLADVLNAYSSGQSMMSWPLDPFSILSGVATATSKIGLVGTLSTTYNDPYDVARRVGALDLLSQGRAGVNLVTSTGDTVARQFGFDKHADHDKRYRWAGEFAGLLNALWDATPHPITHHGERFELQGSLGLEKSPQGRPVIVQAGASEDGRSLAGQFAEIVYAASSDIPAARAFYNDLKDRAVAAGRNANDIAILPGIVPYIGETEAHARRVYQELEALTVDDGVSLHKLAQELSLDLNAHDPDGPVPVHAFPSEANFAGGLTRLARLRSWAIESGLSLRQFAQVVYRNLGVIHWTPVGSAEQIADQLTSWFTEGVADGFNILIPQHPQQLELFVDHVVPILQARGLFRRDYETSTLSGHLGLSRAVGVTAP